ncbi:MAG: hypothetical protein L3K13_07355, partial [Thermoplasmata archaeon]|nr:hypothetical protein [Thermoplasmata archaeon]
MVLSRAAGFSAGLVSALVVVVLVGSGAFAGVSHTSAGVVPASPARSPAGTYSHAKLALEQARLSLGAHPQAESKGGYLWTNITATVTGGPSPRLGAAMAWDGSDGYVLLVGGENSHSGVIGDTWSYQNGTWTNLTATLSGSPPPVALASMAYDPTSHRAILFSGLPPGGGGPTQQTWAYHNHTWTNMTAAAGTPPSGRVLGVMTTDSTDNQILLFSGSATGSTPFDHDTWTYKGGTWTNLTVTAGYSFGRLLYPVGSDDPVDHGVLAYALYLQGVGAATATLIFSSGAWRNVTSILTLQPPLELYGCAGYLGPIASVVSYSGIALNRTANGLLYSLTGEYNASSWTNATALTAGPPDLRIYISCAVNGADQSLLMFGGTLAAGFSGSSWLLSAPPKVTASANHLVVDQGTSVSFTGSVSLGAAPYTYHWSFG